jgi:REP element-mobilizing transposase RayT
VARQLRIEYEGAFYHVTSRGNRREKIYFHEKDKERFLEILSRTKGRYSYLLHAYALMDNHYHLLIETPKANLSQIMQNVNTSYTVYVNTKYKRNGHLFQGRFKGIIVDKDEYLATLSRYIHLNPVRAGIVQRPEEARWTGYGAYAGKSGIEGPVDTADTLKLFSGKRKEAVRRYKAFVDAGIGEEENPLAEVEGGLILGRGAFRDRMLSILESLQEDEELPQVKKLTGNKSLESIVKACAEYYEIAEDALTRRRRGVRARHISIYLAKTLSGRTSKAIGEHFGIKGMAVSRGIKAIEEKMADDKRLRKEVVELKERVLSVK